MAAAAARRASQKTRARRSKRPATAARGSEPKAKRPNLESANRRRRDIAELKAQARSFRLGPAELLADPRSREVKVLTLLPMVPRCTLGVALEALLACQINGARTCGDLSDAERAAIVEALFQVGRGIAVPPSRAMPCLPEGNDRELDRVLSRARAHAPAVELVPSEFAAARAGLESDPLLLRMVDRLVDAVRLYAERDDGGVRARIVAGQWIRYRNYCAKVESGDFPPPRLRGPALLE